MNENEANRREWNLVSSAREAVLREIFSLNTTEQLAVLNAAKAEVQMKAAADMSVAMASPFGK